jgi:aspartyl/asparaginyl beta-hydroxylase (cupin superfamily)
MQPLQGNAEHLLRFAEDMRRSNRPQEEMQALERVLALEPHNLRALLQKAALLEIIGRPRESAVAYRNALQLIPRGLELPPHLAPVIDYARGAVEGNNRSLEAFLEARLATKREQHAAESQERFDECLRIIVQKQRIYRQEPTFLYFPGLPAIAFHPRDAFPWLDGIEAAAADIRRELVDVLAEGPMALEPYVALQEGVPLNQWKELNHSRRWSVYYLWREGQPVTEHLARCPRTVEALSRWPQWDANGPSALFSILDARTRIPAHTGVNNARLTVHLPLIIPPGCGLRVGAERREWEPGKAFVFDDTIEHEAWNDSDAPRAVFIFDTWNPALSPAERELVRTVVSGIGEYYAAD